MPLLEVKSKQRVIVEFLLCPIANPVTKRMKTTIPVRVARAKTTKTVPATKELKIVDSVIIITGIGTESVR